MLFPEPHIRLVAGMSTGGRSDLAIESASMFLKLSLRIAVSFVVMNYGNRPRRSVESRVKPC